MVNCTKIKLYNCEKCKIYINFLNNIINCINLPIYIMRSKILVKTAVRDVETIP